MSNFNNLNNLHRYILEKGSKKFLCPNCGKKSLKRYVDIVTDSYLPEQYGRCDHENSCIPHYHLNPYLDGYAKMLWEHDHKVTGVTKVTIPKPRYSCTNMKNQPTVEPVYFDFDTFKSTLEHGRYLINRFIQNLFYNVHYPFDVDVVTKVVELYRLGTVAKGDWLGAITFPFIDIDGNVRAIQVKQFDSENHTIGTNKLDKVILSGLRKDNRAIPTWLRKYIEFGDNAGYFTCLFAEHLLKTNPSSHVALVEAPKTAIYCSLYFGLPNETPESLVWLAVYNKSSFSFEKVKVLQGRFVYVFPDLSKDGSTFREWETKAKDFESRLPGTRFIVSDLLERFAPEKDRVRGLDLADYLIKFDPKTFRMTSSTRVNNDPQNNIQQTANKALFDVIHKQFTTRLNVTDWVLDPVKHPKISAYNLDVLTEDCYRRYGVVVTPQAYYEAFVESKKDLNWHKDQTDDRTTNGLVLTYYNHNRIDIEDVVNTTLPDTNSIVSDTKRLISATKSFEQWDIRIEELKLFYAHNVLPCAALKLNPHTTITNGELFVESSLAVVLFNRGNKTFLPYLERLELLKHLIISI